MSVRSRIVTALGGAVVVALHGCTQTAADYYAGSGWPKYADRAGFVVVFPEQRTANNGNRCFDGSSRRTSGAARARRCRSGRWWRRRWPRTAATPPAST